MIIEKCLYLILYNCGPILMSYSPLGATYHFYVQSTVYLRDWVRIITHTILRIKYGVPYNLLFVAVEIIIQVLHSTNYCSSNDKDRA